MSNLQYIADRSALTSLNDGNTAKAACNEKGIQIVQLVNSTGGAPTLDTELPAAAALADNTANPTVTSVGNFNHVFDGTTWDRMPGNSTMGPRVNLRDSNGNEIGILGTPVYTALSLANAVNLDFTSASSAGTNVHGSVETIRPYKSITIYAELTGATGGTLDVYLQTNVDFTGTLWVDYAHFAQKADGAGVTRTVWTVSRYAQQTTATAVGTGTTPALAANTIVGGDFGDRIRVVAVSGGGTSAGAAQVLRLWLNS